MSAIILLLTQTGQSLASYVHLNGEPIRFWESLNNLTMSDEYDSWLLVPTTNAPSARYTHGMAYDRGRGLVVLFGGDETGKGDSSLSDTWEYNGVDWSQVAPSTPPPGRVNIDQALVYDIARGKTVLFGGRTNGGYVTYVNDTWTYNGASWTQLTPPSSPPARDSHAMVYDQGRNLTVLFGGYSPSNPYFNDTWEFNGTTWTQRSPGASPPGRHHHSMAYDANRGVVVLFGGIGAGGVRLNDTWEYNGSTWSQIVPPQAPSARANHAMSYDEERGEVVLFGGANASDSPLNDTWEYDGSNWHQMVTTQTIPERGETPLVYDSLRERMVLFGGGYFRGHLIAYNDTWEYVGSSQAVPPLVTEARADLGMPFDLDRGCPSPYVGCGGPYHGFATGVNTDLAFDAYLDGAAFNLQDGLFQDHLSNPGRYRYGTARYAQDLRTYFEHNQVFLEHSEPYQAGDIAYFDWNGDDLADHVGIVSQVDSQDRPLGLVDATGFFAGNVSGRAIERDWSFIDSTVLGHSRLVTTALSSPGTTIQTITLTGPALRISLNSPTMDMRLFNINGKTVSAIYNENFVASNVEAFIPYVPAGSFSDLGDQEVINLNQPQSDKNYYIEVSAQASQTYTLQIEQFQDGIVIDTETVTQSIAQGATQKIVFSYKKVPPGGINPPTISTSPRISTPALLQMSRATEQTIQASINIAELSGLQPLSSAVITTTDLVNQLGDQLLPKNKVLISPANFNLTPGGNQQINIQVNLSDIELGLYHGSLVLSSANGSPTRIPFSVHVKPMGVFLPLVLKQYP